MGMSIYVSTIYGVKVPIYKIHTKINNPAFGVHKFDPDTGKKIEEYITNSINLYSLANNYQLTNISGTYQDEDTDQFVGIETSKTFNAMWNDNSPQNIREIDYELKEYANKRIIEFCKAIDLIPEIKHYIVVNISC